MKSLFKIFAIAFLIVTSASLANAKEHYKKHHKKSEAVKDVSAERENSQMLEKKK